jgi:DNA polymerase elongation subunit (family B)
MSYVSAFHDKNTDLIRVVERVNGERIIKDYIPDRHFFVSDPNGSDKSIYQTRLKKVVSKTKQEFYKNVTAHRGKTLWESDCNLVFRTLAENYRHKPAPDLHVAFLDIESDFCQIRGFAPIEDPFNKITAITVYLSWVDKLITLSIPPKHMSMEEANAIAGEFENTIIFDDEIKMLTAFMDIIEDADVLTGWNSEGYDLPYIVNRIKKIMGASETQRLCLFGEYPKSKTSVSFGNEYQTYELVGRVHVDLLKAYQKFTYEERHSYSLDAISEHELGERKTPYEGSLDELYRTDYRLFLIYNRQDVMLIKRLEDKVKLISLLCDLALDTTTTMPICMGSVAMMDQAIINRAHDLGMIVPNKAKRISNEDSDDDSFDEEGAAGAYVADPKVGIHNYVGVIDINSLYPTCIRALNMGLETIVGQLRPIMTDQFLTNKLKERAMTYSHAWEGQFGSLEYQSLMNKTDDLLTIDWESSGKSDTLSASDCYELIFNSDNKWMISGNGTIFSYERDAIIPGLLATWYKERKEFQKKKEAALDPKEKDYYNRRQHIKKITLNSCYGILLSKSSRFNDKRFGQSVTLTGRVIAKHMNSFVNECITGKYDLNGESRIYADTDSVQFSAYSFLKAQIDSGEIRFGKDEAVQMYTAIGDMVNDSFAPFMHKAFNCPEEQYGSLIKGVCESVGSRGFYIKKKRYAILNYYVDGVRLDDKPKLKAMGLDLRRSDTPKIVQKFLKNILMDVLTTGDEKTIIQKVNSFKEEFAKLEPWKQGTPKRVNKLTHYKNLIDAGKGNKVPGHVRASINWNTFRELNKDLTSAKITDGMKIVVVPLKGELYGMKSVAYPTDESHLPKWFTTLSFDTKSMMESVVEKRVENLLGKLPMWEHIENNTKNLASIDDFFE